MICIALVLGVSVAIEAQTRRALVIGIGQYEDGAWKKIYGDRDVPYVERMLRDAGYRPGNIHRLVNHQATKAAIVEVFGLLEARAERGDIVFVHFSGHGQQMVDLHNDEPDGLDECWIPYDAYRKPCDRDRGEKHLTDDEVNYHLNAIRDKVGSEGKMLVVIDACHSGDATRGDEDEDTEVVRGVEDIFEAIKSFVWPSTSTKGARVVNPKAKRNPERWITLSACQSDQLNTELRSPIVGKLTYAICTTVKECGAGISNSAFFRKIKKFFSSKSGNRPQTPVMTGETDKYKIIDIIHK